MSQEKRMNNKNEPTIKYREFDEKEYRNRPDFEDYPGYVYSELEPWMPYADDFVKGDFYYNMTRPYRVWYEYLTISPTFSLAQKYLSSNGNLTDEEMLQCPDDFLSDIVPTCRDMNLQIGRGSFDVWWQRYGADIFGMRRAQPTPVKVFNAKHHMKIDPAEINEPFKGFLENDREDFGNTGFMLLAIPLSGDRKKMIASVSKIIKEEDWQPLGYPGTKTYKLYSERTHLDNLHTNLRVLWHRALDPKSALWRLGLKARSTNYSIYTNLHPEYDTGTPESLSMASMTSNRLRYGIHTMENAIRGRFPCQTAELLPPIDQHKLIKGVTRIITNRISAYEWHRKRHMDRILSVQNNDDNQLLENE